MNHKQLDKMKLASRTRALDRPELRGMSAGFTKPATALPLEGFTCRALARDINGDYELPFLVTRFDGKWINAKHDRVIEIRIVGWHYSPSLATQQGPRS